MPKTWNNNENDAIRLTLAETPAAIQYKGSQHRILYIMHIETRMCPCKILPSLKHMGNLFHKPTHLDTFSKE